MPLDAVIQVKRVVRKERPNISIDIEKCQEVKNQDQNEPNTSPSDMNLFGMDD